MKNLLLEERFRFWPVCSIAFYAIREKILSVSLPTFALNDIPWSNSLIEAQNKLFK